MTLYLGIDAGGSKTECAIANDKEVLGRFTAGTCKFQRVGREAATASLQATVRGALHAANSNANDIRQSCIGISGASQPEVREWATHTLTSLLSGGVTVVGDNIIAHEAAFEGGAGVLIVAGTGSIVYGRNERGEVARAGGWGPIVSDEGSGNWIGRSAVRDVLQALDGGTQTALLEAIRQAWSASSREEIARIANGSPAPDFAALFPRVLAAAESGDTLALDLLDRAGEQLAQLALIVIQKLWLYGVPGRIAGAGGVLNHSAQIRGILQRTFRAECPQIEYDNKVIDPILGALFIARRAKNHPSSSV
ncbi:MAG: ATPase BadF/BadG/BcrA/BcrD type [Candidatus Angelobacter sp.]|jgi:glucosamine kinase|nr:ATPase BadF/BadG/BcrA/BcrD type [Candidatus Angelobacter sp.]